MSPARPAVSSWRELPVLARANLLLLAAAFVALCVRLAPEWRHNPDLSHGFFMPVVFIILLREARRGPARFLPDRWWTRLLFALLLALGLATLGAAGVYAAAVDWSHPLVNWSLTAAVVLLAAAALIVFAGGRLRAVGCNWSAIVAIVLWILCSPIPPGTYTRITLALQLWISRHVVETLHLLGIAAARHGNIIELAHATVGVEDACSGIRSLLSCVFAGLFFSATLVRRPWARAGIIVLAAPLAVGMNFIRSLTLTLLVNHGVHIAGRWHDLTGYAVLGVTAALLAGLAVLLDRPVPASAPPAPVEAAPRPTGQLLALGGTLTLAAFLVVICIGNTRPAPRANRSAPDLNALLPTAVPGWSVSTTRDLYQFTDTLRTRDLAQRIYRQRAPDGSMTEIILYVAYWHPGQAPVSLVMSHTPDACWPGAGWTAEPTRAPEAQLDAGGRRLPTAEHRLFELGGFPQHVWYWHLYDGRPIADENPYSALALLRLAWKYGFRHDGDQLFVRVSSNRPWRQIAHAAVVRDFFGHTRRLGL